MLGVEEIPHTTALQTLRLEAWKFVGDIDWIFLNIERSKLRLQHSSRLVRDFIFHSWRRRSRWASSRFLPKKHPGGGLACQPFLSDKTAWNFVPLPQRLPITSVPAIEQGHLFLPTTQMVVHNCSIYRTLMGISHLTKGIAALNFS